MKKIKLAVLSIALLFVVTACGCTTWKSFTYNVDNGDKIEIKLKTGDGYNMTSELPFKVTKDGNTLSQGTFINSNYYSEYVSNAENDSDSTILETNTNDNITYTFYKFKEEEFNYVIKIDDSNTALILGNNVSESSAREVFERLSFNKK